MQKKKQPSPPPTSGATLNDPARWVDLYGDPLYGYALLRLRNPQAAQDAVQETLLGALGARQRFSGKSSEKTWLFGILKHKIIDQMRKKKNEVSSEKIDQTDQELNSLFEANGHWKFGPASWQSDPEAAVSQGQFWQVFKDCLNKLPTKLAHAFSLRELDDLDSEEVCKVLNVTSTNLWVMLHRARTRLRSCLEAHWFKQRGQ